MEVGCVAHFGCGLLVDGIGQSFALKLILITKQFARRHDSSANEFLSCRIHASLPLLHLAPRRGWVGVGGRSVDRSTM